MATLSISLPDSMRDFVESQVATGQFADTSDYFRDLIRERQQAVDRLSALLEEGEASGISPRSFDEIIAGIKERHSSRQR
jgi:antitoxin ParD1/3/4